MPRRSPRAIARLLRPGGLVVRMQLSDAPLSSSRSLVGSRSTRATVRGLFADRGRPCAFSRTKRGYEANVRRDLLEAASIRAT
jgi:hypothetical protein